MNYIGTKTIETPRMILRRLTVDDAKIAYDNWCSRDEVAKYVIWDKHESVEVTKTLFKIWEDEYEQNDTFRWICELKDTHDLVGTIDVQKKFINYGTCEIGYCYSNKDWNNGYGTEALKAVVKYLFEECDADTVYAEHMHNNPASGKVMQKAGLKYEGTLKSRVIDKEGRRNDLLCYSITKEEYFNNK